MKLIHTNKTNDATALQLSSLNDNTYITRTTNNNMGTLLNINTEFHFLKNKSSVFCKNQNDEIILRGKASQILEILIDNFDKPVSFDHLAKKLWKRDDKDYFIQRSMDVYISSIRKAMLTEGFTIHRQKGVSITLSTQ